MPRLDSPSPSSEDGPYAVNGRGLAVQPKVRNICCIGAGYVGGPTCAVIADKNPGITVTVVDLNAERIAAWNSDDLPIYEPGLRDVVVPARDGVGEHRPANLFFSTDVDKAIRAADLIFLSVNTPTKRTGTGAGFASDLGYVESAVRRIAEVATEGDKIVVEKSTVPCRTAEGVREILSAVGSGNARFEVLSNPEFLAEGSAVMDLLQPDRVLIGSLRTEHGMQAAAALADVYAAWVPQERIVRVNLWSSELAKLAANALLAQRISSINAISAVCEATGADIEEVAYVCGLDQRIGPKMLKASVGFGGSCFKKDVLSLTYIAESLHLPEVARYWRTVVELNEHQKDRFTRRLAECLYNTLTNKKIAVLGFAYKKDTGDTRETAAISVITKLVAEGARVSVYDPQVRADDIRRELVDAGGQATLERVTVCNNAYDACANAHAIAILTEWDEFSNKADAKPAKSVVHGNGKAVDGPLPPSDDELLEHASNGALEVKGAAEVSQVATPRNEQTKRIDWARVATITQRPTFVFDGRNIVDEAKLQRLGFRTRSVGKGYMA